MPVTHPQAVFARPSTSLPLFTRLDSSCIYAAGYEIFKEQQENKKIPSLL
jgi:hypothetical protein